MLVLEALGAEFTAVLVPGERLTAGAADSVALAAAAGDAGAWFGDHELVDARGAVVARSYAPDWSPEYLRHTDVVNGPVVVRNVHLGSFDGLVASSPGARRHEGLLRLLEDGVVVRRVPAVLGRRDASAERAVPAAVVAEVVDAHLRRSGIAGTVTPTPHAGVVAVRRTLTATPRVSVVVPTRGGTGRVWGRTRTFAIHAVQSLLEHSTYPDLEVVVVADTSTPQWVVRNLSRLSPERVTVVPYDLPFNFSDKINRGVAAASGDVLLLLNDDTELYAPGSIDSMVAYFVDADPAGSHGAVGVVGARLLFDDSTLQHAGHVYNEQPLHAFRAWPDHEPGPGHRLVVARECSGVTAAALMVDRATFVSVGGFPTDFPLDYNDVAFCLAVRRTGRRIIWTPDASWHHFEGRTRVRGPRDDEFARLVGQWGHELAHDPYHHPLLEVRRDDWRERTGLPPNSDDPSAV